MNKLKRLKMPPTDVTEPLSEEIQEELMPYGTEAATLWLFILANQYHTSMNNPEHDLTDYQLAAEEIVEAVESD